MNYVIIFESCLNYDALCVDSRVSSCWSLVGVSHNCRSHDSHSEEDVFGHGNQSDSKLRYYFMIGRPLNALFKLYFFIPVGVREVFYNQLSRVTPILNNLSYLVSLLLPSCRSPARFRTRNHSSRVSHPEGCLDFKNICYCC